jgi:hypothetical protein
VLRRTILVLAVGASVLAPERSRADDRDGDYQPDSTEWNGLADFFALARGLGLDPEFRDEIVWDELDDHASLVVIYPRAPLDHAAFLSYVHHGGRLLIADDFGHAEALLAQLGLARHTGEVAPARYHEDNPQLPIAVPVGHHALTENVAAVVANHPAWLTGERPAVLTFNERDHLCASADMGAGRLTLLSDPSVLINNMLEFAGNLAFATNLLRQLGRPGERLIVVVDQFRLRGVPRGGLVTVAGSTAPPARLPDPLATMLLEFNGFLATFRELAPPSALLHALLVLALAAAGVIVALLVARSASRLDLSWANPSAPMPRSSFAENLARYGTDRSAVSCGMLAGMLRDELEARLCRDLALDSLTALDPRHAVPAMRERHGEEAANRLASLLQKLARIPSARVSFGGIIPVSQRRFAALHEQSEALFAALGRTVAPSTQGGSSPAAAPHTPSG